MEVRVKMMAEIKENRLLKRDEIDAKYKWNLEDIYSSVDEWEKDYRDVQILVNDMAGLKGTLAKSEKALLKCLKLSDDLLSLYEKVFVYARMKRDENNGDPIYQALTQRAQSLGTEVYAAVSFITPELTAIPEETLKAFLESDTELQVYDHFISEILRQKKHVLSDKEEELLALASEVTHAPAEIFNMLNNADIKFPSIKDENGEEVEVTKGRYIKFLESSDRRVREDAFHALYSSYIKQKNTLASMLSGNVKRNKFYATVRKYPSSLEASLDSDNITTDVYDNLIETVNKNLPMLHRYLRLRKKALKLDELHMYDLYVPIVKEPENNIPYEEAVKTVIEGLRPLGQEYRDYLKHAFDAGWIDVYENEGKTSGAYSWGSYKTHPYVLLNYQGTINDIFTIAHEMGHAMHSFYTNKTQPYIYSEYRIFVAEVASTVNEALLMNHLLANTEKRDERAYLLNHYLEQFRGTIFRQVMFAEFEKIIHEKMEKGEAITAQVFCEIYRELNIKYFGSEVIVDSDIDIEWARIPHFYTSFYVYKYATGFSAAISLSKQILSEGLPAVDRYINFLSSGDSNYPLELLKNAGVDLSAPKPIEDAMAVFEEILNELEMLL